MSYYLSPIERIIGVHFTRSGSFEIHPQSDSSAATEWILRTPSKNIWTAVQQIQLTANTDWKGTLGSLTWSGPPSRYWLQVNNATSLPIMGDSPNIYRDGKLLATSIHGDILGAALTSGQTDSGTYIVAAVWFEPDMRFVRIKYIKNEATGNWETVGSWQLLLTIDGSLIVNRPSTIVTFNQSGTECKFLSKDGDIGTFFGNTILNTVTIVDSAAIESELTNEITTLVSTNSTNSLTYQRNVTKGIDNGCAGGVDYLTTDNCPTDLTLEKYYTQSNIKKRVTNDVTTTTTKGIIAADYIDDVPVYATIEYDKNHSDTLTVVRDYSQSETKIDVGCTGSWDTDNLAITRDLTETRVIDTSSGYTIDIGFIKLKRNYTNEAGSISNFGSVDDANQYGYSYSSSLVRTIIDQVIHFLDLRHSVVLYSEEIETNDKIHAQSGSLDAGPGWPDSYNSSISYSYNTVLVDINGTTVLDTSTSPDVSVLVFIGVPQNEEGCAYSTPSSSLVTLTEQAWENLMPWVRDTIDILTQSVVTDGVNNQCTSMEIVQRNKTIGNVTVYNRLGTYYHIFTGGNLDSLTGLLGLNKFYNPITLIT